MTTPDESIFVAHARSELTLLNEDQETIDGVCNIMTAFSEMNLSGGAAPFVVAYVTQLMQLENLTPLTNDPDEWIDRTELTGGIPFWQSKRNSQAFSKDAGKTYYLLSENNMVHTSHDAPAPPSPTQ